MKLKLAVVTLWAEDVERMTDFYQNILGLRLLSIDRGRVHFDYGGGYLIILPGKLYKVEDSMRSRFPVLAFAVDNLDEVVHQLESHNVEMPWGVEEDSDSRWVMFRDPSGNLLEIAMFGINKHRI